MKTANSRVRSHRSKSRRSPQARKTPEAASRSNAAGLLLPTVPWLTVPRLALLKVLAGSRTKFALGCRALTELVRSMDVELLPDASSELALLQEVGAIAEDGNYWRITPAGRAALHEFGKLLDASPKKVRDGAGELEAAINQAKALTELLEYRVLHPDDGGDYCDAIQCGLVELSHTTFTRLERASEGAFARNQN